MTIVLFVICLLMACSILQLLFRLIKSRRELMDVAAQPILQSTALPLLSIIVPIHNEQEKLEQALASLCQLNYAHYEVIAVNDRSTDASQHIISKLCDRYANLRSVTIGSLPEGWLGKTHALYRGCELAKGDYFLFTDADVIYQPDALLYVMQYAQSQRLQHFSMAPKLLLNTLSIRCLMPFISFCLFSTLKQWKWSDPDSDDAIGLGVFNLISREAYLRIGSMRRLALEVVDDISLAQCVKRAGLKHVYADGRALIAIEWYRSAWHAAKGFEKNTLASFDYSYAKACVAQVFLLLFICLPFVALFYPLARYAAITAMVSVVVANAYLCRELAISVGYALLYPVAAILVWLMNSRNLLITMCRGAICWGGVAYSIKQLRQFRRQHQ